MSILRRSSILLLQFSILVAMLPSARAEEIKPLRQLGEPKLRHGYPIVSITYSPDGSLLATAGGPLVRLFKPVSGKQVGQIELEVKATAAAFSPDGKRLAIAAGDHIILRELASGQDTRWRTGADDPSQAVVFSPDGARLAAAGRDLTIWDVSAAKRLHTLKTRQPPGRAVAFSANGKRIAAGDTRAKDEGVVRIWDVEGGEPLSVIQGVEGEVTAVAFTPDGQSLVSASRRCCLQVWDVATGKEKRVLSQAYLHAPPPVAGLPDREQLLVLTPDGQTLYSTGRHDDRIREWDLATGEARRDFRGPSDGVGGLALSPDRKWLAVAGLHGTVELWHLQSGKAWHDGERHTGAVFGLGFTADGKSLQSACTGNWWISWNLRGGVLVRSQEIDFRGTECVLLGSEFAVAGLGRVQPSMAAGNTPKLLSSRSRLEAMFQSWDLATGKTNSERPLTFDGFLSLAPTPRGVVAANRQTDAALVEMITGYVFQAQRLKQSDYRPLPGGMKCLFHDYLLINPEMRTLDRTVRDADLGLERMLALDQVRRRQVQSWAVTAADGRSWARLRLDQLAKPPTLTDPPPNQQEPLLQIREAGTGSLLAGLEPGPLEFGRGILLRDVIAFTPDGRFVIFPQKNSVLKVCEAAGGQERWSLKTGQGAITSVAISPDGQVLASGGVDGSIQLWDLSPLRAKPIDLTAQEVAECWDLLKGEDAVAARRAMWKLVDGAKASLPYLREQLPPIQTPPARRLARLTADLDSNDFAQREKAVAELERLGLLAEEHLQQFLKDNPPLEVRTRIEAILKRLAPGAKLDAGERRILRAVAVLAHMHNEEARKHLEALATGAERMLLTREAKRATEK